MKQASTWGGHPELFALSQLLRLNIHVVSEKGLSTSDSLGCLAETSNYPPCFLLRHNLHYCHLQPANSETQEDQVTLLPPDQLKQATVTLSSKTSKRSREEHQEQGPQVTKQKRS